MAMNRIEVSRRVRFARARQPFTLTLGIIMPVPGLLAVVYGDRVSLALSHVAASAVTRGMGVALLLGAVLILWGIIQGKSLVETAGLTILAGGCVIYGLGVLLGLGLSGVIAGCGYLTLAVGSILRVTNLATTAHELNGDDDG